MEETCLQLLYLLTKLLQNNVYPHKLLFIKICQLFIVQVAEVVKLLSRSLEAYEPLKCLTPVLIECHRLH